MTKIILSIFLFWVSSTTVIAQDFDKSKLDNYFNTLEANNKFMGSVAVSKDGQIIYTKSVGYADFENKIKADLQSTYGIGSITKTFTSVMVLKAVEQKKITLNETIEKYFPAIKGAGKITIKHLLSHRSGIHNFTDDSAYLSWRTQPKTEKELVAIISKGGIDFEPDSKAAYSNSNFVLLTYILEKIFHQSYAVLLNELILQPLSLADTYFGNKSSTKKECKSYTFSDTWKLEEVTDPSVPLGAGAIVSTPTDLVKFGNALFSGKILKPESLAVMKIIQDNFGLGLFKFPFHDIIGYGHTGGIDGFSSVFAYFPNGNISYALTSNGSNFSNNEITLAVLSAVYNKSYQIPSFSVVELSSEDLDAYVGVYSSKQIPLKITISKDKTTLRAQATGQSAFSLEATGKHKFKFDQAGVKLEFNPSAKTMTLKQAGAEYLFAKE